MNGRLALLLVVAAAGCQDREVVGSVVVKTVLVMAASGGIITVTADEDPLLAGVRLSIPPGSLVRDLTVTIERGGQDIADTTATLTAGPVVLVGPAGTQLSTPARLGLPVPLATTRVRSYIEVRDTDGRRSTLAARAGGDAPSVEADIDRFAAFQGVRLRPVGSTDPWLPPPPPPPTAR